MSTATTRVARTLALAAFALAPLMIPHAVHGQASTPPAAGALNDPTIVAIVDAANTWDMDAAGVALQRSRNKDVREFAKMMQRDHKAVRQLGRDLAHKLHVTPTPPGKDFAMYKDHVAAMRTLRTTARGAAFDKAYVDNEVAYHQAVINAVTTTLLPATQNADVKALETKIAPNFQAHLAAAQALQTKLSSSATR
jgi:putative membrane protein